MHFSVSAQPAELPAFFNQFMQITGVEPWLRKEQEFERQVRDNRFFKGYLDIQFALERSLLDVQRYKRSTGRMPPISTAEIGTLYSFIAMTARVFRHLPVQGKQALRDSIVGGLKSDIGLAPLAFEIRTAAHFLAMGADVEFHDLCGRGGYDLLVTREGIQVEVECKSISADLGRPIHLLRQYQLGRYLQSAIHHFYEEGFIQLLVATLVERLHAPREFMEAIAGRIGDALKHRRSIPDASPCSVSYHRFPVSGSPFDCSAPVRIDEQEVAI